MLGACKMKVAEADYTLQDIDAQDSTLSGLDLIMPQSGAAMEVVGWSGQIWRAQRRWEGNAC